MFLSSLCFDEDVATVLVLITHTFVEYVGISLLPSFGYFSMSKE